MRTLNKHNYDQKGKFHNTENIEIYKDTLLKATQYPQGETKKYTNSEMLALKDSPIFKRLSKKEGVIKVANFDTVSAIVAFSNTKCAVLNMASAKRPGGGVAKGSKAQEESLFRCSNLGVSISNKLYPLKEDEFLYTTDAVFFKDVRYDDLFEGFLADVITCAAVNLNVNAIYGYTGKDINTNTQDALNDPEYVQLTQAKVRSILISAVRHGVETLILGAWGCGVFKNDPSFIAQCFKDALNEDGLRYYFDNIIFAVINDKNSVANNFTVFEKTLEQIEGEV